MRSALPTVPIRAFTLLELMIVVAIIAVLAAISVPNFVEAMHRSRLSRATADMRSILTAMVAYSGDHGELPPVEVTAPLLSQRPLYRLTTPIAYIVSIPADTFFFGVDPADNDPVDPAYAYQRLDYLYELGLMPGELRDAEEHLFLITSRGPDGDFDSNDSQMGGLLWDYLNDAHHASYDPTNGTTSSGDLWRSREGSVSAGRHTNASDL
jgi:prepilin-type N-terminal cleavage/methylation domain-containing protein